MAAAAPAGYALAGAAAAVGAGFLDVISTAADFQQHMANVNALLNPTEVQTYSGALNELALTLGKDTVFSADEAATAIGELIKAGVDVPTVLNGGAAAALNLAAATGTDIPTAAAFAGTALNTFHESADQLTHTVDVLTGVANASAASIGSLRLGFEAVGPVAAAIGLSFDDTATALGVFANNGLAGSDAGTSLKTMLLNLEPSTKAQTKAQQELNLINADGTSKFFDASGSAKSMADIFQILKESTANLTAEQKTNLLQTAFGTDAVRAAAIAASEGADGFNKLSAQVQIEGLAAQEAATRQASLEGSMNQLNGSLETARITIGNLFLPALTQLVNILTSVVNAFLTLPAPIQDALVAIVGIAGAVAGLLAGWILLGPLLTSVGAAFGIVLAAIIPILGPLALVAAAAAALYLAWTTDFGGIQEVTQQVWEAIQPALQNIVNFVGTLRDTLAPTFEALQSSAGPLIQQLSGALAPILAQLPQAVRDAGDEFNRMGVFLGQVADVVRFLVGGDFGAFYRLLEDTSVPIEFVQALAQIHSAFDSIGPVVEMVAQAINFLITGNMDRLVELMQEGLPQPLAAGLQLLHDIIVVQIQVWGALLGGIKDFIGYLAAGDVQGAFNSLINTFSTIKDLVLPLWNEFVLVLGNLLGELPGVIGAAASGMWQYFLGVFSSLPGLAATVWEDNKSGLSGLMSELPGLLATAAGDVWQYLLGSFSALPGLVNDIWPDILSNLGGLMQTIAGVLGVAAGDIWQYVLGTFSALPGLVNDIWPGILDNIGGLMQSIAGALAAAAGDVWQWFVDSTWELGNRIPDAINNVLGFVGQQIGSIPDMLRGLGDIWQPLVDGAIAVVQRIGDILGPIKQAITDIFSGIPTAYGGTGGGGGSGGFGGDPGTGGTIGTTSPLISIGTLIISSQEEADAFLNLVAQAVLASARRVTVPATGGNPALG